METHTRKKLFYNKNITFSILINFILKKRTILIAFIFFNYYSYSQNVIYENNSNFIYPNGDIAKISLELEKELNPTINVETYLNSIDSVAQLITCELENCPTIQDSLKIINQYLFQKQELSFKNDCEFITDIIDKKCGNCASFSVFYLAITNRLGIKYIYPVLAPNHVFVRYDYDSIKINIETTQNGENYSNEWYRSYFGVSDKILLNACYFRNLSKNEFVAVLINNRGSEFLKNGNKEKAIEDFNTVLTIFPTLAEVYFGLAHYYSDSGYKQKAIEQYDKVILCNPDFANAYCNRGLLFEQKGVFDSAINDYNNALKLKPNFAEVYYNRGIAYTKKGNYSQAIIDFTTAIKIKSNYVDAYYNRGCAKNLSKDYTGAIQDYTNAIVLGQTTANTYIYRGDCRNAVGDKKGACEDWKIGFDMGYKSDNKKRILKYCKE